MMMRWSTSLLALVAAAAFAKEPATLDDLKTLAQHKAYPELLERAEDVAPAARTEVWRDLIATAAAGAVQGAPIAKDPFGQAGKADALLARFSFLEKREGFATARDEAVLSGLRRCIEADDAQCFTRFAPYEKTLGSAGSLKAGKMLRRYGSVPYRPMALFAKAVGAKDAAACKDSDVADAVVAALGLPTEDAAAIAARQVAFDWCWAALQPRLKTAMVGAQSVWLQNSCQGMRAKKALTQMQEELCKDEEQDGR